MKLNSIRMTVGALLWFVLASVASAHELFVLPATSAASSGASIAFTLSNGDIEKSINSTAWKDIADVSIFENGTVNHLSEANWHVDSNFSSFEHVFLHEGTSLVGVSTKPKLYQFSDAEFADYLKEESIEPVRPVNLQGRAGKPVRERYSKHTMSYIQIGRATSGDFPRGAGYPIEFQLQSNPQQLKVGDTVHFRVLARGVPVVRQRVLGGYRGFGYDAKHNPTNFLKLRTDEFGAASFALTKTGRWYLYLVHMTPVRDPECDVESHYVSLLFDVSA